ncbi:ArsR/SmtB family transcription factor [Bacillus sp. KH172YL63]|uniref:ArsR/SmtB family transcription factor n=1 Tax=Bacillus sp. KH172YL63 TaxID=2709784 RepID=UPI003FA471E8
MSGRKRETYEVEVQASILWESALGIAAITNKRLIDTLEKSNQSWEELRKSLSPSLRKELATVEKTNTWKALLLLLHQKECQTLPEFLTYVDHLQETDLRYICLPYIGSRWQEHRKRASLGDGGSRVELQQAVKDHPFFPDYIHHICTEEPSTLKAHIKEVMSGWFEEVMVSEADKLKEILARDKDMKLKMKEKLNPEALVEWATGGITYLPEPSVHKVLLIPHTIYRPWNVEGDIEGVKIFYYPVANDSIHPDDPYMPSYFLVQKHKALGDEARLRMVKLLKGSGRTLQEITNELNMGKSTVHHHLKILRSARLVESREGKYFLKENAVHSLAKELLQYLAD